MLEELLTKASLPYYEILFYPAYLFWAKDSATHFLSTHAIFHQEIFQSPLLFKPPLLLQAEEHSLTYKIIGQEFIRIALFSVVLLLRQAMAM